MSEPAFATATPSTRCVRDHLPARSIGRGLARAVLTAGLDRLAKRGAPLKVGYATDVARALYVGAGFRVTSTSRSHSWGRPIATA
jgi:ribosomal protein S18 acetylase RimI-like enzyme